MPKRKLNVDLLKRLRTRFLRMRHPQHFDMETWGYKGGCGTVACIAGHALLLSGYKLKQVDGFPEYVSPEGRVVRPGEAARRELSLPPLVASELFYAPLRTPKEAAARIQELIDSVEANQ